VLERKLDDLTAAAASRGAAEARLDDALAGEKPEFATWSDLCEGGRVVNKFYPQIGKTVQFNTFIAYDAGMHLIRRYSIDNPDPRKRDSEGYMLAVLETVMIKPRLSQADRQAAKKAHLGVLLDILKEVLGENTEAFKTVVSDLGPK
jgi:hypothetical protein